jgi:hypothetical protein
MKRIIPAIVFFSIILMSTPSVCMAQTPTPDRHIGDTITVDAPLVVSGTNVFSASKFTDNTDSSYYLAPAGSTALLVNGKVGIGTTAPGVPLHIINEFATGGNTIYADSYASVKLSGGQFVSRAARGTKSSPSAPQTSDVVAGIGAFPYNGSAYLTGGKAAIAMYAAENFSATNLGTYIAFRGTAIGGTTTAEKVRISDAGNVGIGTAAPTALLDVAGRIALSDPGGTPTVSECGSGPAGTITGNDTRGLVTMGKNSPTSCTVTFANAYSTAPVCLVTPGIVLADWWGVITTTTTFKISLVSNTNSVKPFYYICIQ